MNEDLKILLVDDEPEFLEMTEKRLERRGFLVQSALNFRDAIPLIEEKWPDVIVLDVMLPDKDGISCLDEIKKNWPAAVVIMLSGHASQQTALHSLDRGACDYCLKPMDLDVLVEKIKIAHKEQA